MEDLGAFLPGIEQPQLGDLLPSIDYSSAPPDKHDEEGDEQLPKKRRRRAAPQKKREREKEFDEDSGAWTNVRRFNRIPLTINKAAECEEVNHIPKGTYFVSVARKRIEGLVELHRRWLAKTKNGASEYAAVQRDLMDFFVGMIAQFNDRYMRFVNTPNFEVIGRTRRRRLHASEEKKV